MIRALDRAEVSACLFTQPRPAMSADIVKAVNLASSIPHDDQTFAPDHLNEIITRLGDLTLMPDADPLPRKNLRLFFGENLRRNKVLLRESSCPGNKGLDRFTESRHGVHGRGEITDLPVPCSLIAAYFRTAW